MIWQTTIPLEIEDDISLDSFSSPRNQSLIEQIKQLIMGKRSKRILYIVGEHGSGKTHLLNACCHAAKNRGLSNVYLSLQHTLKPLTQLKDKHSASLVCIDDVDQISGSNKAQRRLFTLYESIHNGTGAIIVGGISSPNAINLKLPDLVSRLASGGVFGLYPLNDDEKWQALKARAKKRGFHLEDRVLSYIMSHHSRDTQSLFALLDKLDSVSLQSQRKITIPLVKDLL